MGSLPEAAELGRRLEAALGPVARIVALESGSSGRSYFVSAVSGRYVAKVFAPDSYCLLGPDTQFALLAELAAAGVTPAPAALDVGAGLLVTRHVPDSRHLEPAALREPDRIAALARLLGRLHAVPVHVGRFAPLTFAGRYLDRLGGIDALSDADAERFQELAEIAASLEMAGEVLCHNDLTAENILFGRVSDNGRAIAEAPLLIDFDFAVMAPPVVDLASLAAMNRFRPAEVALLLDAYYGGKVPFTAAEFARVERLQHLLAHFWSLAAAGAGAASVGQYRIQDG